MRVLFISVYTDLQMLGLEMDGGVSDGGGGINCRRRHCNRVDYGIWFTICYTFDISYYIYNKKGMIEFEFSIFWCRINKLWNDFHAHAQRKGNETYS